MSDLHEYATTLTLAVIDKLQLPSGLEWKIHNDTLLNEVCRAYKEIYSTLIEVERAHLLEEDEDTVEDIEDDDLPF